MIHEFTLSHFLLSVHMYMFVSYGESVYISEFCTIMSTKMKVDMEIIIKKLEK